MNTDKTNESLTCYEVATHARSLFVVRNPCVAIRANWIREVKRLLVSNCGFKKSAADTIDEEAWWNDYGSQGLSPMDAIVEDFSNL